MPELMLNNVSVFINNKLIVKEFSLKMNDGELHVLMGPNGSGKTTLVKGIAGHRKYKLNGEVLLDGEDISKLDVYKRSLRGLGIALQEPPPLEGIRVSEVLLRVVKKFRGLSGSEAYRLVRNVIDLVGLDESVLSKYHMLELSGGEKRKVELARILLMNPKVVILDEPDSGVDIDSIPRIANAIYKLKVAGSSILLITHQFGLFEYMRPDRVHVMVSGRKVAEGSYELIERLRREGYESVKGGEVN